MIVDSIQTLYQDSLESPAGSVAQVRACTLELMQLAKGEGITVFVIGHVNKEGSIAGPKVLEHMVDCVLYFEGEAHMSYRILRAAKNRFGATGESVPLDYEPEKELFRDGAAKAAPRTGRNIIR